MINTETDPDQGNTGKKELLRVTKLLISNYLFGSGIPVTKGGFELRISCIRSSYLTYCDPNKS